jgi:hypothetical protein
MPIAPRPVGKASIPAWDDEPTAAPVRVFPVQQAPAAAPVAPVHHVHPKLHISTDTKPPEDDRIGPVVSKTSDFMQWLTLYLGN